MGGAPAGDGSRNRASDPSKKSNLAKRNATESCNTSLTGKRETAQLVGGTGDSVDRWGDHATDDQWRDAEATLTTPRLAQWEE